MKIALKRLALGLASAGMLTIYGCGGGGDSISDPAAPATTAVSVSPALGKFSKGAHVTIKKPDGTSLGSADTDATGKAVVNILASYSGPILIEVTGGTEVTYFDENAVTTLRAFSATDILRAIAPAAQTAIGVTAATNAAVAAIAAANSGNIPPTVTPDIIRAANTKIATALGIADVLQAPKLVGADTPATLNIANLEDKYAFQLAALAKLATSGKTALQVAQDLAKDMADGNLDGKEGQNPIVGVAYAASTIVDDMQSKIGQAVGQFGDDDSKTIVINNPTALGTITPNVTAFIPPPAGTNLSDLQKAKAMFAELRTTLKSFANSNQTGFLDTQAKRAGDDLKANVGADIQKVGNRVGLMQMAMSVFEDATAYSSTNTLGLTLGTNTLTAGSTLGRYQGSHAAVWYGYGSYDYCWTDSATNTPTKVTCLHADQNSADHSGNKIRYIAVELTSSGTNGYTYTSTRYNRNITSATWPNVTVGAAYLAKDNLLTSATAATYLPVGSGTLSKTQSGTQITAFNLTGTLPPSSSSCIAPLSTSATQQSPTCPTGQIEIAATGVDTVAIAVNRTALTGYNYRYALSGSVTTNARDFATSGKYAKLSLDTGSQIDLDETNTGNGPVLTAAILIGSAQTLATKFTGTVTASAFKVDAKGANLSPTSMVFSGVISDTSTGGAGEILTGKLEAGITDYQLYDSMAVESSSNFVKATVAFTGTVQAPSRPLLKLVLSGSQTGLDTGTVTLNYSYGTGISITGSGTFSPSAETMTLSNQDGIQLTPDATDKSIIRVTKAGGALGHIQNGRVNYVDGMTESLN